ncbi:MAG: hypothetical protein H7Y17_00770 [Chlorobia bacterium]|nr:hypothetical protein [Fimbriimonadaceae bacterium]
MLAILALVSSQTSLEVKASATVKHPALAEISGMVQSRPDKDLFWVHNDSGDSARIFAIRRDGSVISPSGPSYGGIAISGAKNVDWEDIALAGGKLYVSDLGSNGNARRDLGVYIVKEPNPATDVSAKATHIPVVYPDQDAFPPAKRHFDCEAVFVWNGKFHLLTKHRSPDGRFPEPGTKLYRLDTMMPGKANVAKKLEEVADMKGWVTAADTSPDGRWLAVLTQFPKASVWIFDTKGVGDKLLSKPTRWLELLGAKQCESICFDGPDRLMVGNEQRDLFGIKLADIPRFSR